MEANSKVTPVQTKRTTFEYLSLLCRLFLSEMLGLGFICFVAVIYPGQPVPTPIVVGVTFVWVAWVFGPISGAQVNPVVTLALFVTRRLSIIRTLVCVVAQFVGAAAGAWIGKLTGPTTLWASNTVGMTFRDSSISVGQAIGLEFIATSVLLFLILSMLDEFRVAPWAHGHVTLFPFGFGATLSLLASIVGSYTGASMNPARSLGPALVNNNYTEQWIYFVGPMLAMVIATSLYEMILSEGASLARLKAWFTNSDFDRTKNYKRSSTIEASV